MFFELIVDNNKKWYLYNIADGYVAPISDNDIQLFQTLRFRLILSIAIYALLSLFDSLSGNFSILISICIFFAMTFYYYRHAIPQLKWLAPERAKNEYLFINYYFSKEKITTRAATLFVLTCVLFVAFFSQTQQNFTQESTLIIILGVVLLIEFLKQIYLLKKIIS